ncbi:ZPR1 zinc finger domain-containing protein [Euryarchaeota archaeon]|nr:ZPR1 zinc finger domain-containing protein [Euryarchaeota archaeon]
MPCPVCHKSGNLFMIAHVDEIPYFGEHTQVTVMCHDCGWKQTDFIPAEGKKAGCWSLKISDEKQLNSRIVRSSSCTISIPELDLQVNPGSNATGYVSNVEGVINRFIEIVRVVLRDLIDDQDKNEDDIQRLTYFITSLENAGKDDNNQITLELLDPHGHSMIVDNDAKERDLTEDELNSLPIGPDPAVFSK